MSSNCISRDPPNLTLFREGSGRFGRGARGRDTGKFLWPPRTLSAEESASWRLPEDSIPSSLTITRRFGKRERYGTILDSTLGQRTSIT